MTESIKTLRATTKWEFGQDVRRASCFVARVDLKRFLIFYFNFKNLNKVTANLQYDGTTDMTGVNSTNITRGKDGF